MGGVTRSAPTPMAALLAPVTLALCWRMVWIALVSKAMCDGVECSTLSFQQLYIFNDTHFQM